MISAAHPVAPEDLMALLDGELAADEAQAVSSHLADCAECAELAQQFRAMSQSLANWKIEDAPLAIEKAIMAQAARAPESPKTNRAAGSSFLNFKRWAISAPAAAFAILLLLAVSSAIFFRSARQPQPLETFVQPQGDSLSVDGQAIADQKSQIANFESRMRDSMAAVRRKPASNRSEAFYNYAPNHPAPQPAPSVEGKSADRYTGNDFEAKPFASSVVAASTAAAPMIARTVSLTIVVQDVPAARARLDRMLASHRAYAAQLTVNTPEGASRNFQASLRVPAPELTAALAELRALGRVQNESQSGEEVTQQHADLVARLQNSRETEQRLRDILAQRTGKIEDVLQVEEEIARVRGEIEGMEADQKVLEHRVDFSTVDLQLNEEYKAQLDSPSASVGNQIRNAFVSGLRNAGATLLGLLLFVEEAGPVILIWLAILALPAAFLWRRYKRLRLLQ
jgi:hypothetical protein